MPNCAKSCISRGALPSVPSKLCSVVSTPLGVILKTVAVGDPPQTPAAQFKRLYRNCPGRKSPAQSCLVCRGSPDRDLTFMRTDLVSPVRKLLNSGCGKQLGNQLGNPVNRPKAMTMTLSCRLTIFSNSELSVESAIIDRHDVDRSSTERKSNPRCRTYRIDNELLGRS